MGDRCINCEQIVNETNSVARLQIVRVTRDGVLTTTLESWSICIECDNSSPGQLADYVMYALL